MNLYTKIKVVFFLLLTASCSFIATNNFYQKTISFQNQKWSSSQRPSFDFAITDTSSLYNIFIVIRHTDAYAFNNIWIDLTGIAPGDTAKAQQLNLKLGDNKKWLGSEMDDIIEERILITQNPIKLTKGKYSFFLQQIMREDELANILDAGIRIEKITN